jgi:hypothetical protein
MKIIHFVLGILLIIAFPVGFWLGTAHIAAYKQALADLRADAARVNQEVICYRYLLNEYEPAPHAVEDCKGIDVDITSL